MKGEWPVLLNIMGKGEGDVAISASRKSARCSSNGHLPARIAELDRRPPRCPLRGGLMAVLGKIVLAVIAIGVSLIVATHPIS